MFSAAKVSGFMLTAKDSAEKILFHYLRYPIMSIFVSLHRCANEFLLTREGSPRRLMVKVQLSQARRGAEGGQGGSEDAHQHLNNSFPSFFFHVYQELEN